MLKVAKIAFVGDTGVGKSSIVARFQHNVYTEMTPTIGAAFVSKTEHRENETIRLEIWDTAGQERFQCLAPLYFKNMRYAVLVFDVTDSASFQHIAFWKDLCDKSNPYNEKFNPTYILVGNKIDLPNRAIARTDIDKYCIENKIEFYRETSGRSGTGITDLYETLVDDIHDTKIALEPRNKSAIRVPIPEDNNLCPC